MSSVQNATITFNGPVRSKDIKTILKVLGFKEIKLSSSMLNTTIQNFRISEEAEMVLELYKIDKVQRFVIKHNSKKFIITIN